MMDVLEALVASDATSLERYGLAGLRQCWMPELERWSHKYHLDGRTSPNESVPHSDIYYSLNVLLGLARVRHLLAEEPYDVRYLLTALTREMPLWPVRNGASGMALWAAAELDLDAPGTAVDWLQAAARTPERLHEWTAQDLGLSLSGACAQALRDPSWIPLARQLAGIILGSFRGPGSLFRDSGQGTRRGFATFATQVYAGLSLYHYAELAGDDAALDAANACVARLIELQGRFGEWPWFYLPAKDSVLDPYEVYSVHQHGMAPALLHHAVVHGVPGARDAIVKGFNWVFGVNEMAQSMLRPDLQLIYRSQARRGIAGHRAARPLRALAAATIGRADWPHDPVRLRLTEEMRSYEFGWLLWSFGGRTDYPDLVSNPAFAAGQRR
jgi:hypothetical protein